MPDPNIFQMPTFTVSEPRLNNPNDLWDYYYNNNTEEDPAYFGQFVGGGSSGNQLTLSQQLAQAAAEQQAKIDAANKDRISPYKPTPSGDPLYDRLQEKRLADINEGRRRNGLGPLTNGEANAISQGSDGTRINSIAENLAYDTEKAVAAEHAAQISDAERQARSASVATAGTAGNNSGIPLVIPIPGIDPLTGLAITTAGLIFSGGNVARLDPGNPIGSVVNAAKGAANTGQNAIDVIGGDKSLSDIWGLNTTTGMGTGTAGPTSSNPIQSGVQSVAGIFGTGSVGAGSSGQVLSGGSVTVTPGALGGTTSNESQTSNTTPIPTITGLTPASGSPNQSTTAAQTSVMGPSTTQQQIDQQKINQQIQDANAQIAARTETDARLNTINTNANAAQVASQNAAIEKAKADAAKAAADEKARQVAIIDTRATQNNQNNTTTSSTTVTGTTPNNNNTTSSTTVTGTTPNDNTRTTSSTTVTGTTSTGGTATMPITTSTPTYNFVSPTNSGLAQRDFAKEFGLTAATLTGKPGDDLAAYYKQLQQQFTPSSLTTLGTTAETQLAADLARYNQAQTGNLSAEDTRNAQQSAREAYAARGQVMGQGAIGAEILNRDALQRQRTAEARASVQQSIGNLRNAADLQTGNIFSPFAKLISENYSPQSPYAREVYDYNVNAYNAYQAAQQNLAAYKEAASKGQEAQFINSFVGFLTNNGIQTTTSAVQNIINGLLRPSTTPSSGTPIQ